MELLEWFPTRAEAARRAAIGRAAGVKDAAWLRRAHATIREHHDIRVKARELLELYGSLAAGKGVPATSRK